MCTHAEGQPRLARKCCTSTQQTSMVPTGQVTSWDSLKSGVTSMHLGMAPCTGTQRSIRRLGQTWARPMSTTLTWHQRSVAAALLVPVYHQHQALSTAQPCIEAFPGRTDQKLQDAEFCPVSHAFCAIFASHVCLHAAAVQLWPAD